MGRGLCYNQWDIPTPDEVILAEITKSFNYDRVLKNKLAKGQSSIYFKLLYMYGKKILEILDLIFKSFFIAKPDKHLLKNRKTFLFFLNFIVIWETEVEMTQQGV